MKNQVIKNLNPEMGKEIIKYFQSLGVDTQADRGICCVEDGDEAVYYGIIRKVFNCYTLEEIQNANAEIIELPKTQFKRGDKVFVWGDTETFNIERIFLTYIEGSISPYVCVDNSYEISFLKGEKFITTNWKNAKAIPAKEEPALVELTLKDISEGKGVGVPVELLRIKAD